jgi:predicted naringenin-chalcone synthase
MVAKTKAGAVSRRVSAARQPSRSRKWSKRVMEQSDAMDLQAGLFKLKSARAIARSLKNSSEASQRRKSSPFRSAMSMLNFEINRAGKNLSQERIRVLNQAKVELRKVFGRPAQTTERLSRNSKR